MAQKVKADEIPHQAHLLFIKLYCNRKAGKDKNTVPEAKKTWNKLSLPEKKQFYKTIAESNLLKYAHSLSKTETYLKGKLPKKLYNILDEPQRNKDQKEQIEPLDPAVSLDGGKATKNGSELSMTDDLMEIEVIDDDNQNNTNLEVTSVMQSNSENNQQTNDGSLLYQPTQETKNDETRLEETVDIASNTNCIRDGIFVIPLKEPEPPKIKNAKELYEIIKKPGDIDWKDVTSREKYHYSSAVYSLKRAYIKNYKQYLESLPQQQLFDHYMKTLY